MTRRRTRPMLRRAAPHAKNEPPMNARASFLIAVLCFVALAPTPARAASLEDYRARVERATTAMEDLHTAFDEEPDVRSQEFLARERRVFEDVRAALPATEKIEGAGVASGVDNRWLHAELDLYEKIEADNTTERDDLLYRVALRLRSLLTHLTEAANAEAAAGDSARRDKEAEKGRLNAILRRAEYNQQAAEDTAIGRYWREFKEWLRGLMPKSRPLNEGTASAFSLVARLFVFALTAAIVGFVLWKYGARLLPQNRAKKKTRSEPRVVLGERLAPGQTPADLITEAEALARAGDVRGAIRKAYIAVLFELGERSILRLAAHKTNRDYLSALRRESAALYGDMQPLTYNYERHWYGFAPATDADWHDFRSRCRQVTQ
ncbi:MAG TPA: DUF4129 domain-containing protein [Pyrinomonadaceae bacterium]|nr:DUF4129 domain-containing protein [Pyrinomonadaceae bacterium]